MPVVNTFCLKWHLTKSRAFEDIFSKPLAPFLTVRFFGWEDGETIDPGIVRNGGPAVFCQLPPPENVLAAPNGKLVWIPMWDHVRERSQAWWNSFPKTLRVVAYSNAVATRARKAGLPVLRLRYFKSPEELSPVRWDQGNVLMYWNRSVLIRPRFLRKICKVLRVRKLIFREHVDPYIARRGYYPPPFIDESVEVKALPEYSSPQKYLEETEEANILIAPRAAEGVGMVMLEQLARGSMVFAYDAPTMNEYISHGENGYLFDGNAKRLLGERFASYLDGLALRFVDGGPKYYPYMLSARRNWAEIANLDMAAIGRTARERCVEGHRAWTESIKDFAAFILDWGDK